MNRWSREKFFAIISNVIMPSAQVSMARRLYHTWCSSCAQVRTFVHLLGAHLGNLATRNGTIFHKCKPKSYFAGFILNGCGVGLCCSTRLLRWALLQHTDDQRTDLVWICQILESNTMQFFTYHGWPFLFQISQYTILFWFLVCVCELWFACNKCGSMPFFEEDGSHDLFHYLKI